MKTTVFWNVWVYRPLRSQWKDLIIWTKKREKTLWTVITCSLTFFMLEITRKIGPKNFLHWKGCPFFKTLCFQQFLTSQKNAVFYSSVNVTKACGPFQSVPWLLSHSVLRVKVGQIFCHRENGFFWNVCFYRILRSRRNDLNICTIFVKMSCGQL